MDNSWIKLYRKAKDNGMLGDHKAWAMFSWILMSVDINTGTCITGRFILSTALRIKPGSIDSIIKRLATKYEVINIKASNKNTEIQVRNWSKYQSSSTQEASKTSTTKQKKASTPIYIKEERIRMHNVLLDEKMSVKETVKTSKNSLTPCTSVEIEEIAKKYLVSKADVERVHDSILNAIAAREFKHKTVYFTLIEWLKMRIDRGQIRTITLKQDGPIPFTRKDIEEMQGGMHA